MNAILLAAGYGTRLYPLTRNLAKPLLDVGGRPMIDYLVEKLDASQDIDRMLLVTNARFAKDFEHWAAGLELQTPLDIYDDGSTDNENRRGAVADISFAAEAAGVAGESAYVLATDNLPRFELLSIVDVAKDHGSSAVFVCPVADRQKLRRMGVAELAEDGRIIGFEEKPERPRSNLRVPPFYVYTAEAMGLVAEFMADGNNPDAPGHFLAWLVQRSPVYAEYAAEGTYDIGTLDSYRAVCEEFNGRA
jgi:glucose-1-phosphate thymidylyltransferase